MIPFFKPSLSLWIGIGLTAAIVASVYLHFREVGQLRERLEVVTAERDDTNRRLASAQLAVSACMQVNLENAQARDRAAQRAVEAEKRVAEAANHADQQINSIMGELDRLRSRNLDCPAIDGRFRVWVRNN